MESLNPEQAQALRAEALRSSGQSFEAVAATIEAEPRGLFT